MAEPTIQLGGGNWAGKTDNLLGYYKEGERFYKQDFTFLRSTTGTYTDSEGYIQEMPYNLLTYSEDFTQWTNTRSSDSEGFTSPDGTNNATLLKTESDSASNNKYIQSDLFNISSGATISGSVFLKANQLSWARVILVNSSLDKSLDCFFNISSGVVGTSSATGSSTVSSTSIENVGNGWFRCSIIGDLHTSTNCRMRVYLADGDNDSSVYGDGTSSIYIYGAQVNKGSSAKTYFPTTTRLNMPRVDYLNNSNGSLILEPQRTNLITQSQAFDNSYWTKSGASVTSGFTSPDGTNNAYKLVEGTNNGGHTAYKLNVSISSGVNYTYSIFVKGTERVLQMVLSSGFSSNFCNFDLSDGTIGSNNGLVDSNITSFSNGWYRCDITALSNGTSAHLELILAESKTSSRYTTYQGNGTSGVYIYGAQLEQGNYATTLINTSGSSVTRNADACSISNVADRIGQTEGTLYGEFDFKQTGSTNGLFAISDGSFNNFLMVRFAPTHKLQVEGTGGINIIESTARASGTYKIAIKYDSNGVELWVGGSKIIETSTQSTMSGIDEFMVGKSPYGNVIGCKVNQAQVYKTALSDTELATLTTL